MTQNQIKSARDPVALPPVQEKWNALPEAEHYAGSRFSTRRAHQRDPDLIGRLLKRHGGHGDRARVLDLPCGTGRLHASLKDLAQHYVGADVSIPMLSHSSVPAVAGDAFRMPFVTDAFDTVVCCRLLHHLEERGELPRVIDELLRVSSDLVFASFWDADSLPAWRRRVGLRKDTTGRRPVSKRVLRQQFESAGAQVLGFAHSFRFISMQCFVAVRVGNAKG
jgi:SAM-dependent methyltransferase